ncbi:erythromycin esterase family protein [Mucilaginibacter sp. E4BP6]|uniref:erythromycin esterase family protein n=1 Tax=Mucilaginibacter sp. E4BP6 TaxID=2723089 RepID=UPI0015C7B2E5|nr:erythromycin esterase family protein [Mucilaginibacter sp. E4BP6]NYE68155.1 erythromycin esterase [Mucilaginibacter sp. E4BP6]
MLRKFFILSTCIANLFFIYQVRAQSKLTNVINQHLIALTTLNPNDSFNDLDSIKPYLSGKSIFGIGEATHGTHEFVMFKHRMLEFLVKEKGVKTFVIEDDFAAAQVLNDYILNDRGPMPEGMDKGMVFGIWKTREMIGLFNWLKLYNASQTTENKVRFFGCDMQYVTTSLGLLKEYLQPLGKFSSQMERALNNSKKPLNSLQDSDRVIIREATNQLSQISFTTGDTAIYHHYVREVQQYATFLESSSSTYKVQQFEWRDKCMAENIEWIYHYTGNNSMVICTHNSHIAKTSGSMNVNVMGQLLSKYFGNQYYAMAFDFYSGSMRSYNLIQRKYETPQLPESVKGSSGAVFAQCRVPNFFVDIKSCSEPVAADFFNKKISSISIGFTYFPNENYVSHKLGDAYDAIIFIKETTPVHNMY